MSYVVGETTYSLQVAFSGYVRGESSGHPPVIASNSFAVSAGVRWEDPPDVGPSVTATASALLREVTAEAFGTSDSDSTTAAITSKTLVSGTATISADCEILADVQDWDGSAWTDEAASLTMPERRRILLQARLKEGGDLTVTVTMGTLTASASQTITSTIARAIEDWTVYVALSGGGNNSSQDAQATITYHGLQLPGYTASGSGVTIGTAYGDRLTVSVSSTGDGVIRFSGQPRVTLDVGGVIRTDAYAYTLADVPIRVTARAGVGYDELTATGGAFAGDITMDEYAIWGDINGTPQTGLSEHEWGDTVTLACVPPASEDASETDVALHGWQFPFGTLSQAATYAVDGGFSVGATPVTRTYSGLSARGYRYLLIQTDTAAATLDVAIGAKEWMVATDSSGLAVIDLCGPHNLATDSDAKSELWPDPPDVDTVSGDGCMWGVEALPSLVLAAPGCTLNVASNGVYLSRDTWSSYGHATVDVCPAVGVWADDTLREVEPFLRGDTDGRRSLDVFDRERSGGTIAEATLADIETLIGDPANVGWTFAFDSVVDVADGSDGDPLYYGYLNRNRPASWLEGSGARHSAGAWSYAHDMSVASGRSMYAQVLADEIRWFPLAGDVFGHGPGSTPASRLYVRGSRRFRGVAWGLAYTTGLEPYAGATLEYRRASDDADGGSALVGPRGEYLTGLPGGGAGLGYRAVLITGATPYPEVLGTAYTGHRRRACFAGVRRQAGCIEVDRPREWVHVGAAKRLATYHARTLATCSTSGEWAVDEIVRLRADARTGILYVLTRTGSNMSIWASGDRGLTAQELLTVTASTACVEIDSERGAVVCLYASGGSVYRTVSLDAGQTWSTPEACAAGVTPLTGEVYDMSHDPRTGWMFAVIGGSGTASVYRSGDLGLTWQAVIA